jgi:hypothetical protein
MASVLCHCWVIIRQLRDSDRTPGAIQISGVIVPCKKFTLFALFHLRALCGGATERPCRSPFQFPDIAL